MNLMILLIEMKNPKNISKVLIYSSILIFLLSILWTIFFEEQGPGTGVLASMIGGLICLPLFLVGLLIFIVAHSNKKTESLGGPAKKTSNLPFYLIIFIGICIIFALIPPFNFVPAYVISFFQFLK